MPAAFRKLAVVVDTFPKWSERFIARELQELKRCGVDFSVFCLKPGSSPVETDPDWNGLIEQRVVLPRCIASSGGALDFAILASQKCASKLSHLLKDAGYTHVHAHFASLPSTIGFLAADAAHVRFSMSVHARDVFVDAEFLDKKITAAQRIFTCHSRAAEFLKARGATNVTLMHHGLPLDQFPFVERSGPPPQPAKFIAVCRFVKKKGLPHALAALANARVAATGATLDLIGDGPEQSKLEKQVKALKLKDRVRFLPPQSAAELLTSFRNATALLAPYETAPDGDADGIPNIILEAFAAGLPVIGTNAGSLSEILTPETGTVVPEKDADALAAALAGAATTPYSAEKLRSARERVEQDFDIRKNIAPLLEILKCR